MRSSYTCCEAVHPPITTSYSWSISFKTSPCKLEFLFCSCTKISISAHEWKCFGSDWFCSRKRKINLFSSCQIWSTYTWRGCFTACLLERRLRLIALFALLSFWSELTVQTQAYQKRPLLCGTIWIWTRKILEILVSRDIKKPSVWRLGWDQSKEV